MAEVKRRFEHFRPRLASTLLYCIGENILTSTGVSDKEQIGYDTIVAKLDTFFQVRKDVIFKHACCNQRYWEDDEYVEWAEQVSFV